MAETLSAPCKRLRAIWHTVDMQRLLDYIRDEADDLLAKYGEDIFWIGLIVLVMLLFSGHTGYTEWRSEHLQMQEEEGYNL